MVYVYLALFLRANLACIWQNHTNICYLLMSYMSQHTASLYNFKIAFLLDFHFPLRFCLLNLARLPTIARGSGTWMRKTGKNRRHVCRLYRLCDHCEVLFGYIKTHARSSRGFLQICIHKCLHGLAVKIGCHFVC